MASERPSELLPEPWFGEFRRWVREHLALDFTEAQRRNLSAGIGRAMHESGLTDYAQYWARLNDLEAQPLELARLARLLTVTETHFFRDEVQMRALQTTLLPRLIDAHAADQTVAIWSAGCATGEEPYTLAILLADLLPEGWQALIYGTDINSAALDKARQAHYRPGALRDVPAETVKRFFTEEADGSFQLDASIRQQVRFSALNLIASDYPEPFNRVNYFDLIICRNVLIYFAEPQSALVVRRLHDALRPTGFMLSGQTEPINRLSAGLRPEMLGNTIVYRKRLPSEITNALRRTTQVAPPVSAPLENGPIIPPPAPEPRERKKTARLSLPLYDQALSAANTGQWEEALNLCRQAIAQAPVDYRTHQLLGLIHETRGELGAARDAFRNTVYLNPEALLAHFYLANVYHRLSDARELRAWATLHKLLENRPSDEIIQDSVGLSVGYLRSLISTSILNENTSDHATLE